MEVYPKPLSMLKPTPWMVPEFSTRSQRNLSKEKIDLLHATNSKQISQSKHCLSSPTCVYFSLFRQHESTKVKNFLNKPSSQVNRALLQWKHHDQMSPSRVSPTYPLLCRILKDSFELVTESFLPHPTIFCNNLICHYMKH